MGRNRVDGIFSAVVTPFNEDESIDFSAWSALLNILIPSGVRGLIVIGGQGEFFALTEQEPNSVHSCVQAVAGRIPLYVNVGAVTTREAKRLAQVAESEGVNALVVRTPYYLKPSAETRAAWTGILFRLTLEPWKEVDYVLAGCSGIVDSA